MTDGIIQQTFNKYSFYDEDIETANQLMQELIKRIKQESIEIVSNPSLMISKGISLQKLIGDNQE